MSWVFLFVRASPKWFEQWCSFFYQEMMMIYSVDMSARILKVLEDAEVSNQGFTKTFDQEVSRALKGAGFMVLETIDSETKRHCWYVFSEKGSECMRKHGAPGMLADELNWRKSIFPQAPLGSKFA